MAQTHIRSGNNNTLGVSNVNDEIRHNLTDEVSELSAPDTHFDRQAHTHHKHLLITSTDGWRERNPVHWSIAIGLLQFCHHMAWNS